LFFIVAGLAPVRHRPRSPVLRTIAASTAMDSLLNKLPRCSFRNLAGGMHRTLRM
jgi:hypothetical protein